MCSVPGDGSGYGEMTLDGGKDGNSSRLDKLKSMEERDPFMETKYHMEQAEDWLLEQVDKYKAENLPITETVKDVLVNKAFKLFMPEFPTLDEINDMTSTEKVTEKKRRILLNQSQCDAEARNRMPEIDALGRAYATGKRKTAVARVWVSPGTGNCTINGKTLVDYFPWIPLREEVYKPLFVTGHPMKYDVWCTVKGGGFSGQAGAVKLGIARALQAHYPEYRAIAKSHKLLTQDDRQVEREKPGQARSRKKFAWVKR
jgi:small subunit ribosomal protein S9